MKLMMGIDYSCAIMCVEIVSGLGRVALLVQSPILQPKDSLLTEFVRSAIRPKDFPTGIHYSRSFVCIGCVRSLGRVALCPNKHVSIAKDRISSFLQRKGSEFE